MQCWVERYQGKTQKAQCIDAYWEFNYVRSPVIYKLQKLINQTPEKLETTNTLGLIEVMFMLNMKGPM